MEKIILASNNKHKIKEFQEIYTDKQIIALNDIGFTEDIVEDGNSYLENALIKAKTISKFLKNKGIEVPVIAEDSGLGVNSLNGAPGIYSARYAGGHDNVHACRAKLLKELEGKADRTAYYTATLVEYFPDDTYIWVEARTEGEILKQETVENNFGYDPLFYSYDLKKSFSEATMEEKNSVSHRARAILKLREAEKNLKK